MNILSLDCSTKSTGYAFFNDFNLIDYGVITANHKSPYERIKVIVKSLKNIIELKQNSNFQIDKIVIEEVRPDTEQTEKSRHTNKILTYLQAAIAFMLNDDFPQISLDYLYPSEWRKAVGIKTGRGIKRQELKQEDIKEANSLFHLETSNDDIADACLIGYGYQRIKNVVSWGV